MLSTTVPLTPPPVTRKYTVPLGNTGISVIVEETITTTYNISSIAPEVLAAVFPPVGGHVLVSADFRNGALFPGITNGTNPDGTPISPIGVNDFATVQVVDRPGSISGKSVLMTIDTVKSKREGGVGARILDYQTVKNRVESWYTYWMYFPEPVKVSNFLNIIQWKSAGGGHNDPTMILNIGNTEDGKMRPYIWDWTAKKGYNAAPDVIIPVGEVVRFDAYYKASGERDGRVTFWMNKKQILTAEGVTKPYAGLAWGVGNYSDALTPAPWSYYLDGVVVRDSRPPDLI